MADTIQVFSACENKMYAYYANKPQREKETVKEPERSTEVKARANDREFAISEVINIPDEEFTVKFYDNGAIDHDTISVFYNGKLVLSKQELTEKSITLHLKLDPSGENVIVMYADNLGEIIPNTAAMLVEDGNFRKTIFMSSTLKKSSAIAVRLNK
jgi:hypothetical protein